LKRLVDEDGLPGSPEYALAWLVRASPRFERASFEKERILARVRIAAAAPIRGVWAAGAGILVLSLAAMATAALVHPASVVFEDALALSVERALAGHPPRDGSDLERRHLRFPSGRYRALASTTVTPNRH
jgi:hypothetical protein